jgi:hypothetical protein
MHARQVLIMRVGAQNLPCQRDGMHHSHAFYQMVMHTIHYNGCAILMRGHLSKLDVSTLLVEEHVYVSHNNAWACMHVMQLQAGHLSSVVIQAMVSHLYSLPGNACEPFRPPAIVCGRSAQRWTIGQGQCTEQGSTLLKYHHKTLPGLQLNIQGCVSILASCLAHCRRIS